MSLGSESVAGATAVNGSTSTVLTLPLAKVAMTTPDLPFPRSDAPQTKYVFPLSAKALMPEYVLIMA